MSEAVATSQQGLTGKYLPYPEYKDSGVVWLGEMPSTWVLAKTARYFKIAMGQTILKEQLEDDGEWPVYSATEGDHYFGRVNNPQVRLGCGDLVIPARGNSIGFVKLVKEQVTTTQTTIYCKHLTQKIYPEYAYYFMVGQKKNLFWFTQTAIPQITVEEIGSNPILLPSFEEQRTIAAFLDYETSRIDRLIAQQQRLIELLKEKRQTVISHAVTKGLNPNAPMKDSGVEWLGQVPEHWQIQKTAWHFTAQKGRNGQMLTKEYCGENSGDYPVYSGQTENNGIMGRIDSFEFDFGNDGCLFSTTVGAKAMSLSLLKGKFSLSQNCMVIIPRENNAFSVSFAFYHFQPLFSYERGLIPEHMQASFRMDDLYQYSIAMPPVSEQIEISDFINGEVIKIDYLVQIAEKAITLMQERRSALISAAVTGKIDLRGWTQPAEEVAA